MSNSKSLRQIVLPNSTPMPNFFLDDLMHLVPKPYFCVLMVIWRKTIGWDKPWDWIALSQIQRLAGVCRDTAIEAVRFWIEVGLIRRVRRGIRGSIAYAPVLEYDKAVTTSRVRQLVENANRSRTSGATGRKNPTSPVDTLDTQEAIQEKQPGESNAPSGCVEDRKARTQLAIRKRELKEAISAGESHSKNRFLPAADRARLANQLAAYREELAHIEAALAKTAANSS